MKARDIFLRFPELTYQDLTIGVQKGYLDPHIIEKRRISRREYTPRDMQIIETMYPHWKGGMPLGQAFEKALQDLGWNDEPPAHSPSREKDKGTVYHVPMQIHDLFIQNIFEGNELTLDQICRRAAQVLQEPAHQETLRELLPYLGIEETASKKYRYKG